MEKILLFIFLINSINLQGTLGYCLSNPGADNLNLKKISGIWYEIQRTPSLLQLNEECTYYNLIIANNNSIIIEGHSRDEISGAKKSWNGIAIKNKNTGLYHFEGKYSHSNSEQCGILETDYDNYLIIYSCVSVSRSNYILLAWLLGRSPQLSQNHKDHYIDVLKSIQWPIETININQINC
ncbi:apolipoprotein D-like [Aphidius gifuensis]|uniref:apolipoprotein D-like n=1 Tax=Aphidius gifuensis TaxID=684658 RepID=UPI001CDBD7F0|nr:apolipoprotein D-like [Aphidius gifuensis]